MQNKDDDQILDNLAELSDAEIEETLGAGCGRGRVNTLTCECYMGTWQRLLTCCG